MQTLQTSRTAAPWNLLVVCTNEGGNGGCKGHFEQGIKRITIAPKTYQQNTEVAQTRIQRKICCSEDRPLYENISSHTWKNEPSRRGLREVRTRHQTPFFEVLLNMMIYLVSHISNVSNISDLSNTSDVYLK